MTIEERIQAAIVKLLEANGLEVGGFIRRMDDDIEVAVCSNEIGQIYAVKIVKHFMTLSGEAVEYTAGAEPGKVMFDQSQERFWGGPPDIDVGDAMFAVNRLFRKFVEFRWIELMIDVEHERIMCRSNIEREDDVE